MNIESAKYKVDCDTNENSSITAVIDGENWSISLAPGNRHYDEIMKQVEAGTLTIEEAESE